MPRKWTYEALLSQPANVVAVQNATRSIERVGGKVSISAPNPAGGRLVTLELPEPYQPADFVPGLPFYPS